MPEWVSEVLKQGPLLAFFVGVLWALWQLGKYAVHRMLDQDGLAAKWVEGERQWRSVLTERLEEQQKACEAHNASVLAIDGDVEEHDKRMRRAAIAACDLCQTIVAKELPDSSAQVAVGCSEIKRIIGEA